VEFGQLELRAKAASGYASQPKSRAEQDIQQEHNTQSFTTYVDRCQQRPRFQQ
jgi:hypothetical protein